MDITGDRQQIVSTAVKFLQNPKVQNSPLVRKKEFLKKKGLSDEEVEVAVQQAAVGFPSQNDISTSNAIVPAAGATSEVVGTPESRWRWRGVISLLMLCTAATYGVYKLLMDTVIPWLRGESSRGERIEKCVVTLSEDISEHRSDTSQSLKRLEKEVLEQGNKITQLTQRQSTESNQDHHTFTQLKSEITSLKGLLVNRNSFPPAPKVSAIKGNVSFLPSWQLESRVEQGDRGSVERVEQGDTGSVERGMGVESKVEQAGGAGANSGGDKDKCDVIVNGDEGTGDSGGDGVI